MSLSRLEQSGVQPHMMANYYSGLQNDINTIASTSTSLVELIDRFNKLILEKHISDKPIAYTDQLPQFACWNIACGDTWVDPSKPVGPSLNPPGNPTNNKTTNRDMLGHYERMACCTSIIKQMQKFGVECIAVPEAPFIPNEPFYQNNAAIGHHKEKSNNIRLAFINTFNVRNGGAAFDQTFLAQFIRVMKPNFIPTPSEIQIIDRGPDLVVNIHLTYKHQDPAGQAAQADFLNKLLNYGAQINRKIIIMGDSNIICDQNKTQFPQHTVCFGAPGCQTVDVIMSTDITRAFYQAPGSYNAITATAPNISNRPTSSAAPTSSSSSSAYDYEDASPKVRHRDIEGELREQALNIELEALSKKTGLTGTALYIEHGRRFEAKFNAEQAETNSKTAEEFSKKSKRELALLKEAEDIKPGTEGAYSFIQEKFTKYSRANLGIFAGAARLVANKNNHGAVIEKLLRSKKYATLNAQNIEDFVDDIKSKTNLVDIKADGELFAILALTTQLTGIKIDELAQNKFKKQ